MGISSVCQRLYVHFDEINHKKCISSKPSDEVGKIAKSSHQHQHQHQQTVLSILFLGAHSRSLHHCVSVRLVTQTVASTNVTKHAINNVA
jgi:hypothetical protein